jgi:hypothetical protein
MSHVAVGAGAAALAVDLARLEALLGAMPQLSDCLVVPGLQRLLVLVVLRRQGRAPGLEARGAPFPLVNIWNVARVGVLSVVDATHLDLDIDFEQHR